MLKRETLEHYKFKEAFIHRTKETFISFMPARIVERISEQDGLNWHGAQTKIEHRWLPLRFEM